jgi:hypothetical protein
MLQTLALRGIEETKATRRDVGDMRSLLLALTDQLAPQRTPQDRGPLQGRLSALAGVTAAAAINPTMSARSLPWKGQSRCRGSGGR